MSATGKQIRLFEYSAAGAAGLKHQDIDAFSVSSAISSGRLVSENYHAAYPFENEKKPGFDRPHFVAVKRAADIAISLILLPVVGFIALFLFIGNPFSNAGPLFYVQERMGRNCKPFRAIKFRTMKPAETITRTANCPVEEDRITPLGRFLRKTRIDELPQVLNVLAGDMSLIGPRPDYYDHACHFLNEVPGYRERHIVRPGISGLAQTEVGYAAGKEATQRKVHADLHYISHSGFRMEAWLVWRTLSVIFRQAGT